MHQIQHVGICQYQYWYNQSFQFTFNVYKQINKSGDNCIYKMKIRVKKIKLLCK